MSHRFKKPKMFAKQGNIAARMIRYAQSIRDQEQLDLILAQVPPAIGAGFVEQVRPHLKFTPRQFAEMEKCP